MLDEYFFSLMLIFLLLVLIQGVYKNGGAAGGARQPGVEQEVEGKDADLSFVYNFILVEEVISLSA